MFDRSVLLKLADLRIAEMAHGPDGFGTSWGDHRQLIRQWVGEVDDQTMVDSLVLLWKRSYLRLIKWDNEQGWRDFSQYSDFWEFVNGTGFRMILTPEGRDLLQEMEAQRRSVLPVKHNEVGFLIKD